MPKTLSFLLILALVSFKSYVFGQTIDYQKTGDSFYNTQNYQAALDSYNKAIGATRKDKSTLATLYFSIALCQQRLMQPDSAMDDYNKAILLNTQLRDAYWNRGTIFDKRKDYQAGIADYFKAISLSDGDNNDLSILNCNIAYDELRVNEPDKALKADSIAISLNPVYSRAYDVKGDIHDLLKNYEDAINDYSMALIYDDRENPKTTSRIYADRGDSKENLNKYKDAINDYSAALKLNGDNRHAYWNRGAAYHENGDYKLAADDYTTAMAYYKDDKVNLSKLYEDKATNELRQSLLGDAIHDDSVAITLDPANKAAYFDIAAAHTQNAEYQLSIDYFNKYMAFYKDDKEEQAFLYYTIARSEYFLNEFDKVITDCTMAISLNPVYSSPYGYRGKVYLKKMHNQSLAMSDFNKVIALDTTKKTVDYIFALYYSGRSDDALSVLQNELLATTDISKIRTDYYNLACLYSLMNKPDEANIYLKKAVDNGRSKKYAMADEDLDNIRQTDDYKSTMAGTSNQ